MVDIKPGRTNWKQFCEEAPLSDEEHAEWKEMCAVIIVDDAVFTFVEEKTEVEWKASTTRAKPGDDWSDMVKWADASRRLARAEIQAWRLWKGK